MFECELLACGCVADCVLPPPEGERQPVIGPLWTSAEAAPEPGGQWSACRAAAQQSAPTSVPILAVHSQIHAGI